MADLRPTEASAKSYVFGFIKLYYDGKDVTTGARIQLTSGEVVTVGAKGFFASTSNVNRWTKIKAIRLPYNGKDYDFPNLWIRTGPAGSKTYFGHVTVDITRSPTLQKEDIEEWDWKVENKWNEASAEWLHYYKRDLLKTFMSLVRRTGSDGPITRKIATDRQDIDVGF